MIDPIKKRVVVLGAWDSAGVRAVLVALVMLLPGVSAAVHPVSVLQHNVPGIQTGGPAPDFDVRSLDGRRLHLADLKGKIVVLNFWFLACPPCRVEIPKLNQLVEEYSGTEVAFIAFASDSERELREFLETHTFNYQIVPDATPVAADFGVTGAPTHILIDQQGVIRYVQYGELSDPKAELSRSIQKLLR